MGVPTFTVNCFIASSSFITTMENVTSTFSVNFHGSFVQNA